MRNHTRVTYSALDRGTGDDRNTPHDTPPLSEITSKKGVQGVSGGSGRKEKRRREMQKLCPKGHSFSGRNCKQCLTPKRDHGVTYGWKWDQLSRRFRQDNPLCHDCENNGRVTPSREVHHIVPIDVDPSLMYTRDNLVALCKGCHARRHTSPSDQA